MIYTARQIEELHRSNGQITLPYRARLSPLAKDWLKQRKIVVGYADIEASSTRNGEAGAIADAAALAPVKAPLLWWCDGPCGPAKAAVLSVAREQHIEAIEIGVDPRRMVEAVRLLAKQLRQQRISGGIMLVQSGALAAIYANRCASIRAVLGTTLSAVEQAVKQAAANVLIIEHPQQSLPQVRNLVSRFLRDRGEPSEQMKQQLQELAACE
jgi:ribose 5-phosphate isomerase RpiB